MAWVDVVHVFVAIAASQSRVAPLKLLDLTASDVMTQGPRELLIHRREHSVLDVESRSTRYHAVGDIVDPDFVVIEGLLDRCSYCRVPGEPRGVEDIEVRASDRAAASDEVQKPVELRPQLLGSPDTVVGEDALVWNLLPILRRSLSAGPELLIDGPRRLEIRVAEAAVEQYLAGWQLPIVTGRWFGILRLGIRQVTAPEWICFYPRVP